MKIVAITQARYGSSRLPGKILKTIQGKSLLEIHLKRILQSKRISLLKIATTTEKGAEKIIEIGSNLGVQSYQGSIDDVLERFYKTAQSENPDYVVRLTSDCPLIDPIEIDNVIDACILNKVDYASNTLIPTFPDGIDVEVFKYSVLEKAYKEATLKSDREHVTSYIWRNSNMKGGTLFTSFNVTNPIDYSKLRMTVDMDKDFILLKKLIEKKGINKTWLEYVMFLNQHDEIRVINAEYERNEGYINSLQKD
ncbi:3-deoxy-manno-octulosonate cytidylyltransferase [termite gut metagenome]|uniref:3-deoxy-manno-octulosonate cytidylyltransferase n=1 Tax=termite gut metagenome TaxID=433724 RepID=A0A5J4QFQ2_9ZZZZ